MNFSVFQNLAGTLKSAFRIGKSGPTLHSGQDDPNTITVSGAIDGDIYIRNSSGFQAFYQKRHGAWYDVSCPNVKRVVVQNSTYTASATDTYIGVNYAGQVDIYLPPGVESRSLIIKDEGGNASESNPIRVIPTNGNFIEGDTDAMIISARSSMTLIFGSEWLII